MIHDSILTTIGSTPLVRLKRMGSHLKCNLFAKCEFFNPGGSIKDRIAYRMVLDAEKEGRIKPGDTLIEPTSGNTGIGLALAGAVRGYRVIITMPEKMSREKQVVLEALGAEIIRTPTEAAWDAPESHIGVAKKLQKELPNAHILDQYANPSNPNAHYDTTAQEILDALGGKVDMVVMGAGTGGTLTGVARKIKEKAPHCLIIGADPVGSILAGGHHIASYKVEGIGYDFIPDVLDREYVDEWVKTSDRPSFVLARRLIREEGLLCGGSSGSAMHAALQMAPRLKEGQNCVVLLPDGIRNYLSKFVDNKWMQDHRFMGQGSLDLSPYQGSVKDLIESRPNKELHCLTTTNSISEAISLMRDKGISQLPITHGGEKRGKLAGMVKEGILLDYLSSGLGTTSSPLQEAMDRAVPCVEASSPITVLEELSHQSGFAVVIDKQNHPTHVLSKIDLLEWMASKSNNSSNTPTEMS